MIKTLTRTSPFNGVTYTFEVDSEDECDQPEENFKWDGIYVVLEWQEDGTLKCTETKGGFDAAPGYAYGKQEDNSGK